MNDATFAAMRRHGLLLGLFALAVALFVGLVHTLTADDIDAQRRAAERKALYAVLPPTVHDNDLLADSFRLSPDTGGYQDIDLLGLREPRAARVARLDGKVSGFILPAVARDGYSGDIALLVGIRIDGRVTGVRVLEHRETPGLGDKIEPRVSDWILAFDDKRLGEPPAPRWRVRKDGGDFDQFVGATVTPRAVVDAVRRTLRFFELNSERLLENHG